MSSNNPAPSPDSGSLIERLRGEANWTSPGKGTTVGLKAILIEAADALAASLERETALQATLDQVTRVMEQAQTAFNVAMDAKEAAEASLVALREAFGQFKCPSCGGSARDYDHEPECDTCRPIRAMRQSAKALASLPSVPTAQDK